MMPKPKARLSRSTDKTADNNRAVKKIPALLHVTLIFIAISTKFDTKYAAPADP